MPEFEVTEERTIYLTWLIEAGTKELAITRMRDKIGSCGTLLEILEDDCEVEYEAVERGKS